MAIVERELTSLLADKDELRRLVAEQNEKMGFVRVPGATAAQARAMMIADGIRPENNEATRELMRVRYGDDWEAEQMGEEVVARGMRGLFIDKRRIQEVVARRNNRMGFVPNPTVTPEEAQEAIRQPLLGNGLRPQDNIFTYGIIAARERF